MRKSGPSSSQPSTHSFLQWVFAVLALEGVVCFFAFLSLGCLHVSFTKKISGYEVSSDDKVLCKHKDLS